MDRENQNAPNTVDEILRQIEEKTDAGEYIYRGESKHFETVSSNLYRVFLEHKEFDVETEQFDIEVVQKGMLEEAEKYLRRTSSNCELLAEMQHYGGKTNLIDFTTDCCVALFFACEKFSSEDGRIIFQKGELIRPFIKEPPESINRVVAQSSVFVRPPEGFIRPNNNDVINIPSSLKIPMLEHLRTEYDVSTETIYNDIHGFITYQENHLEAYVAFYKSFLTAN
ncbi:FRG domain-containing protein [Candidatus Poribacteria bacterium]|nr:FRG domain-containing protein [Candidatus Poribacteria bacterium]MYH80089.1 FRG domain-containing protein [Candidatus Poribacteria bacterium]MYK93971.1 FRG domain-containing protein [Candidatus Poribacteria bacterium]